jgi:cytochrome c-type biogenesis protein CcmH/NrfG
MKTTARAPFMPLTDVDDDRLEQLAREKGVGTLAPATMEQRASSRSHRIASQPTEAQEARSPKRTNTPRLTTGL